MEESEVIMKGVRAQLKFNVQRFPNVRDAEKEVGKVGKLEF